jgi:hypothetical protein
VVTDQSVSAQPSKRYLLSGFVKLVAIETIPVGYADTHRSSDSAGNHADTTTPFGGAAGEYKGPIYIALYTH